MLCIWNNVLLMDATFPILGPCNWNQLGVWDLVENKYFVGACPEKGDTCPYLVGCIHLLLESLYHLAKPQPMWSQDAVSPGFLHGTTFSQNHNTVQLSQYSSITHNTLQTHHSTLQWLTILYNQSQYSSLTCNTVHKFTALFNDSHYCTNKLQDYSMIHIIVQPITTFFNDSQYCTTHHSTLQWLSILAVQPIKALYNPIMYCTIQHSSTWSHHHMQITQLHIYIIKLYHNTTSLNHQNIPLVIRDIANKHASYDFSLQQWADEHTS